MRHPLGVIVSILEEDDYAYALVAFNANGSDSRWYPVWQLVPDGFSAFTFRHLLFSFLMTFSKKLAVSFKD